MAQDAASAAAQSLDSYEPTPIAQLGPELFNPNSRVVDGVVTITWPYSIVTKSIAFILAEPDFRLRRDRGQVRIEFHGAAGRAVADANIAGGDEVRIGLGGVHWEAPLASTPLPGKSLDWQLKFSRRVSLRVRRAETGNVVGLDIDDASFDAQDDALSISAPPHVVEDVTASSPIDITSIFATPRPKSPLRNKRTASNALELDEYASPAYLKRARVSYGSLFEGGLDIFDEDAAKKTKKTKPTRFSMGATGWRYSSKSPTPEPDGNHDAELLQEDLEVDTDIVLGKDPLHSSPKIPMVDGASQTIQFNLQSPPILDTSLEKNLANVFGLNTPTPLAAPNGGSGPQPLSLEDIDSINVLEEIEQDAGVEFNLSTQTSTYGTSSNIFAIPNTTNRASVAGNPQPDVFKADPSPTTAAFEAMFSSTELAISPQQQEPSELATLPSGAPGWPIGTQTLEDPAPQAQEGESYVELINSSPIIDEHPRQSSDHPSRHSSVDDMELQQPQHSQNNSGFRAKVVIQEEDEEIDEDEEDDEPVDTTKQQTVEEDDYDSKSDSPERHPRLHDEQSEEEDVQDEDEEEEEEATEYELSERARLQRAKQGYDPSEDEGDYYEEEDDRNGSADEAEDDEGSEQEEREYTEDEEEEEEAEEERMPKVPARAVPQEPIFIDLLSDSDDDEPPARPPEMQPANPQTQEDTHRADSEEIEEDEADSQVHYERRDSDDEHSDEHYDEDNAEDDTKVDTKVNDEDDAEDNAEANAKSISENEEEEEAKHPNQLTFRQAESHERADLSLQADETDAEIPKAEDELLEAEIERGVSADVSKGEDGDRIASNTAADNAMDVVDDNQSIASVLEDEQPIDAMEVDSKPTEPIEESSQFETQPPITEVMEIEEFESQPEPDVEMEAGGAEQEQHEDEPSQEPHAAVVDDAPMVDEAPVLDDTPTVDKAPTVDEAPIVDTTTVDDAPADSLAAPETQVEPEPEPEPEILHEEESMVTKRVTRSAAASSPPLTQVQQSQQSSPPNATAINNIVGVVESQLDHQELITPADTQLIIEDVDTVLPTLNEPAPPEGTADDDEATRVDGPEQEAETLPEGQELNTEENENGLDEHDIAAEEQIMEDFLQHATQRSSSGAQDAIAAEKDAHTKQTNKGSEPKQVVVEKPDLVITSQSLRSHRKTRSMDAVSPSPVDPSVQATREADSEVEHQLPAAPEPESSRQRKQAAAPAASEPMMRVTRSKRLSRVDPSLALVASETPSASPPEAKRSTPRPRLHRTRTMLDIAEAGPEQIIDSPFSERATRSRDTPSTVVTPQDSRAASPAAVEGQQLITTETTTSTPPLSTAAVAVAEVAPISEAALVVDDETLVSTKTQLLKMLRTALPDNFSLKTLPSSLGKIGDVMAVATTTPAQPYRPKAKPRDYMLELLLLDPSSAPSGVHIAQLYRPHQAALPKVNVGDVILLRRVQVLAMSGRGFGVRITDSSSWAVFEKQDPEMLPQIRGPPVETTDAEVEYAQGLRRWWQLLDDKTMGKIDKANSKILQTVKDGK